MATGGRRADAALREGLARWVAAHAELVPGRHGAEGAEGGRDNDGRSPHIESVEHAGGGMANETVLVDLGPSQPGIVVRLPPLEPTFPDYELAPRGHLRKVTGLNGALVRLQISGAVC